jgi:energy-coupling factor transporter transmembrane protein EcfT
MNNETVDYGNWVPKKMLWILLGIVLTLVASAFLPVPFVVQIILWIIAAFLYFFSSICLALIIYLLRMTTSCSIIYTML